MEKTGIAQISTIISEYLEMVGRWGAGRRELMTSTWPVSKVEEGLGTGVTFN